MIDTYLVPEKTSITAKGDGPAVDISSAANHVFLATLKITNVIEQESIDLNIQGSADGTKFSDKPLASFPQKFYTGEQPLLVDLSANSEVKFLRAHWEVNRWGRGVATPMFELQLSLREVPAEILADLKRESA